MSFWSAVIGGGAALGSSLLGSDSARKAQEEANSLTRELYYADREWNKPVNQVERLREAGLNPNLVYGNGGNVAGNTSKGSPRMESIGGYDVDFVGAVNAALTANAIEKQMQETENLKTQNVAQKEQVSKLKQERRGVELDNELKQHDLDVVKGTPTTSKDHGVGSQVLRGALYVGKKLLNKGSKGDFVRGASNLVIPSSMRSTGKDKKVEIKNKPWFMKMSRRPWFMKSKRGVL